VHPIADCLLLVLRLLSPWDENHRNIPTFQELQAIMNAGTTCGHLRADMKTRPDYIAVKDTFLEAAGLPKPLWVPFKERVLEYARRNLHDLQAL
jgi:hypothetical protein